MVTATHSPLGGVPTKQEWNSRWLLILIATALLAATAGLRRERGRSSGSVLTGTAYSGIGQVSAQAPDGVVYGILLDGIWWTDSKGSLHGNGRGGMSSGRGQVRSGEIRSRSVDRPTT